MDDGPSNEMATRPSAARLVVVASLSLAGCALLGLGFWGVQGALADQDLAQTDGVVVASSTKQISLMMRSNSPNAPTHDTVFDVQYQYTVAGDRYTGRRHSYDELHEALTDPQEIVARLAAVAPGEPVAVYYSPADPAQAVLARREMGPAAFAGGLGLGLLLAALFVLRLGFRDPGYS
ncbi:unnamed protein product [Laminaria digitata]